MSSLPQGDLLLRPDQRGWEQEDRLLQAPLGLCHSELPPPLCSPLRSTAGLARASAAKASAPWQWRLPGESHPAPAVTLAPSIPLQYGDAGPSLPTHGTFAGPSVVSAVPRLPIAHPVGGFHQILSLASVPRPSCLGPWSLLEQRPEFNDTWVSRGFSMSLVQYCCL